MAGNDGQSFDAQRIKWALTRQFVLRPNYPFAPDGGRAHFSNESDVAPEGGREVACDGSAKAHKGREHPVPEAFFSDIVCNVWQAGRQNFLSKMGERFYKISSYSGAVEEINYMPKAKNFRTIVLSKL